jgi:uncharacterized protein (TIGR02246 family)
MNMRATDLSDAEAMRQLVHIYADAYDRDNAEAYAGTFTEDGVLDNSATGLPDAVGRAEIAATFQGFRDQQSHTIHMTLNHILWKIEGDAAYGQCYFYALGTLRDGSQTMMAGRYEDEYARTDQGWRLSRRKLVPLLPSQFGSLTGVQS